VELLTGVEGTSSSGRVAQPANLADKIQTKRKKRLRNGRAAPSGPCWKPRAGCRTC
jgi:hypothetical protein